jgi:excinuclease ABC subunit A
MYEGAVAPWKGEKLGWWKKAIYKMQRVLLSIHKPIIDLTK